MIILDTNVVSEPLKANPEPGVVRWLDAQDAAELAITAVTAAELLFGVMRMPPGNRRSQLEQAVQALVSEEFEDRIEPFDISAARHYAEIVSDRERAGVPASGVDTQIAAICRSRSAILATRNLKHFEGVGITVINPWDLSA